MNPERNLWSAILTLGLRDAAGNIASTGMDGKMRVTQRAAEAWVGSQDFNTVCALAGFEPQAVIQAYRRGVFSKENWKTIVREES